MTEIPLYCDDNPTGPLKHSAVADTNAKLDRSIDSRVELTCTEDFWPQANGRLESICTAHTATEGIWVPTGICACQGKGIDFNHFEIKL